MQQLAESPGHVSGPFRTVVVGVDEHQGGRDATALAADLIASDGSLTLATVHVRDPLVGRSPDSARSTDSDQRALDPQAPARHATDVIAQPLSVESTSVGRGLHELLDSTQADLLVVGSCRRGLLGRVMLGDETSDALNDAPCAIAIAPFGYAERPTALTEIGVAFNGSPESEDALAFARALAAQLGSRVSAFEAVAVPAYMAMPGVGAAVDSLPALVDQALARITALGDVEPHAAYGVPAEELALYSASLGLLVVGSRGYGPIGRLVHGSTSRQLGRTARCPLLILTRNARAQLGPDPDHPLREVTSAAAG